MNNPQTEQKNIVSRALYESLDWVEVFLTALVTVILLFTFFFRIVVVSGASMETTLQNADYLVLTNLGYSPKQGDVVVLQTNGYSENKPLIKRVIATEGQWLDIYFDNWEVRVGESLDSMEVLDEPYVQKLEIAMRSGDLTEFDFPMQIREGHIFVMGDNRNNSFDSRNKSIGQVNVNSVIGRAAFRLFPMEKMGAVS